MEGLRAGTRCQPQRHQLSGYPSRRFYKVETTVDGLTVVTPRAWEDLSEILQYHEELGLAVSEELTNPVSAKQAGRPGFCHLLRTLSEISSGLQY